MNSTNRMNKSSQLPLLEIEMNHYEVSKNVTKYTNIKKRRNKPGSTFLKNKSMFHKLLQIEFEVPKCASYFQLRIHNKELLAPPEAGRCVHERGCCSAPLSLISSQLCLAHRITLSQTPKESKPRILRSPRDDCALLSFFFLIFFLRRMPLYFH